MGPYRAVTIIRVWLMKILSPYALGATLYMRPPAWICWTLYSATSCRTSFMVVCLEDAVAEIDVDSALRNLHGLLTAINERGGRPADGPLLFVRPRDSDMAAVLNEWPLMARVDGFVVPKLTLRNLGKWEHAVTNPALYLMPTLETTDVFNPGAMVELGQALKANLDKRIIALRIGGNDLMGSLGLRRNPDTTLYNTPMGYVIPMLAGVMGSQGFALTAPVFEQARVTAFTQGRIRTRHLPRLGWQNSNSSNTDQHDPGSAACKS